VKNLNTIKHLESKGVLQILLFLLGRKETKVTDIEFEGSNSTLYRALNTLAKLELIDEERVKPYTRYIHLTGDGEAIAKKLKEIAAVLEAKKARQQRQAHS
jgi:DNA-binding HxlR family transcriptional regulator